MTTPLPLCRWRRQPVGADRHACISPRVRCHSDGIADADCFVCRHRDHDAGPGPRRQCVHFGRLAGAIPLKLLHRTDGASVVARVHSCAVHGRCTPNTLNTELRCCMNCDDHRPDWLRPRAGEIRHLTYHLYPSGPMWRWNVKQLLQRLSLFNGRRLVTVALGPNTDEVDEVRELLAGQDVEFVIVPNDPNARELVSHVPMIARLEDYRSDSDVTFYGHGKGASSYTYGKGVERWAAAMYASLLDYWPAVRLQLASAAAVGVYRRILSPAPAAHVGWHYSGSFRWLRNKDLYSRNWRAIDTGWYGPETYPGRHFTRDESSCLFGEFAYGGVGLYAEATWDEWAQRCADDWYQAHAAGRQTPELVTVIVTAHAQPVRVHDAIASVRAQTTDAWQCLVVSSGRIPAADLMGPYTADARIQVMETGEDVAIDGRGRGQAWAINEAWRRGRVRGDLVTHLSDDDVLAPSCLARWLAVSRLYPEWAAWYGSAERLRIHQDGRCEVLGPLELRGVGRPDNPLRTHVDGLQVCCRRSARTDWPEDPAVAAEADGRWMDALAIGSHIHPVDQVVGTHRHTPQSCFTR